MKDLWKSGVVFLIIIGALYIIFLRECKSPDPCPADGEMIITKDAWDSLVAISKKPPIVKIDTVYLPGDTIYLPGEPLPQPVPDPADSTIHHYADSLIRSDINVWVDYSIEGRLLGRTWRYRPIITLVTKDSTIFVGEPVIIEKPVLVPHSGLYGYFLAGGNKDSFLFGGGLDYITKKETIVGYMHQRFGNEGFHSIKLGAPLFRRK